MTSQIRCSKEVGDLLVIAITGCIRQYIASVISKEPLELKVQEDGPYARLKNRDFIINELDSVALQTNEEEATGVLKDAVSRGYPLVSGLAELGVTDGELHNMLPVE